MSSHLDNPPAKSPDVQFKRLSINMDKVHGAQADFPLLIRPSMIEGLDRLTPEQARSVRFYSGRNRVQEFPREVVSADEIYVKIPLIKAPVAVVFMHYDGLRPDYRPDYIFGAQAVWSTSVYAAVYHLSADYSARHNLLERHPSGPDAGWRPEHPKPTFNRDDGPDGPDAEGRNTEPPAYLADTGRIHAGECQDVDLIDQGYNPEIIDTGTLMFQFGGFQTRQASGDPGALEIQFMDDADNVIARASTSYEDVSAPAGQWVHRSVTAKAPRKTRKIKARTKGIARNSAPAIDVWFREMYLCEASAAPALLQDSTRNRNNGHFTSTDPLKGEQHPAPMGLGMQLSRDGFIIPSSASMSIVDELTLSAWVMPNTPTGSLIRKGTEGATYDLAIDELVPSMRRTSASDATTQTVTSDTPLTMGQWNHVVAVDDGGQGKIIVNGSDSNSAGAVRTGHAVSDSWPVTIGNSMQLGSANNLNCALAEVRILCSPITEDRAATEYNNQFDPSTFFDAATDAAPTYA